MPVKQSAAGKKIASSPGTRPTKLAKASPKSNDKKNVHVLSEEACDHSDENEEERQLRLAIEMSLREFDPDTRRQSTRDTASTSGRGQQQSKCTTPLLVDSATGSVMFVLSVFVLVSLQDL